MAKFVGPNKGLYDGRQELVEYSQPKGWDKNTTSSLTVTLAIMFGIGLTLFLVFRWYFSK